MPINENDIIGYGPAPGDSGSRHTINHLPEEQVWEEDIYCIETGDYVVGGLNGVSNLQARQLTNRTAWLKKRAEDLQNAIDALQPGSDRYDELIAMIRALDASTTNARLNHLERLMANAYLAFQMAQIDPDGYDGMIIETFDGAASEIDQAVTVVTSVVSGDDSIDVEDSSNLIIGAHYQMADGENVEEVKIKSINVSGAIKRVILEDNVRNQYTPGKTRLYRSSVAIFNGRAYGGGTKVTDSWNPARTFEGALTPQAISSAVSFASLNGFESSGATIDDGSMILGSPIVGVALVSTGAGGTFATVDEEGDDLSA